MKGFVGITDNVNLPFSSQQPLLPKTARQNDDGQVLQKDGG